MKRTIVAALAAVLAVAAAGVTAAQTARQDIKYIHAGRLLADPASGRVETNKTVVVIDGRVTDIRDGFTGGTDGEVVDLRDSFVMPGLIDSHVHILGEGGPENRFNDVLNSDADDAISGAGFAMKTLKAGFTTVVDLGEGGGDAIFALRDGIAAGRVPGPRILAAGSTITPHGGHADAHGYREDILHLIGPTSTCSGADDCRRAVREQVKRGVDVIKVTATGGVLSNTRAGLAQQMTDDELKAIVETAHQLGRKVAAHAHGVDGINAALRAGVDSIEHGSYLDAESIKLFKAGKARLVPTLLAGDFVVREARAGRLRPNQAEKALIAGPLMVDAASRARAAGVRFAFGTDSGVSKHGDNAQEFALLVRAGFTPMQTLQLATVEAAEHLGLSNEIGRLKPGMAADIIAVKGDPLADVREMERVSFVMRNGAVFKR
ncbi:MAG TPA: amidohydrolase family protein [Caulobacteraceae bacterium]|nr:amidohydrolase family protein [Caulobacteraceae bacterium]